MPTSNDEKPPPHNYVKIPPIEEIEAIQAAEIATRTPSNPQKHQQETEPLTTSETSKPSPHSTPPLNPVSLSFQKSVKWLHSDTKSTKDKYRPGLLANSNTLDPSFLLVNLRQKGNPVLSKLRNVKWQYTKSIEPDFQFTPTSCALFLSLRFHHQNVRYIGGRISTLPNHYLHRVLLVLVDTTQHEKAMLFLNKLGILSDMTLILAFSESEVARYLETFKAFENKSADSIKERCKADYLSQVTDCLRAIKPVNSTNSINLLKTFGSVGAIFRCTMEQLSLVPGLGEKKIRRIYNTFNSPIISSSAMLSPRSTERINEPDK